MAAYPKSLENLIESFRMLPGIGQKAAERHALYLVDKDGETIRRFAQSLLDIKEKIIYCETCGNLTEDKETCRCDICKDSSRDHATVCVVQSAKDILAMEKSQEYKGVYFVLNGLISASKGVMPEDLNLEGLLKQAKHAKEVIFATSTTQDGDVTAMYLSRLLHQHYPELTVTRIARGLPTGAMLDYADEITVAHALEDRKEMR